MNAFSAGFFSSEVKKKFRHAHHTGIFIHYDHSAGTHYRAGFGKRFIIYHRIKKFFRNTSAGRSAKLNCLELLSVFYSSADFIDNVPKGHSHWNFYKPAFSYLSGKSENLRAFAVFGTEF